MTGLFPLQRKTVLPLLATAALLAACGPRSPAANDDSLLVVVSFDGFRWDYPELHGAPTLLALARDGVRADSLVPSFPTKTYPNHYTLATGLRPERHGIVANTMWDPLFEARFSLADRSAVEDGRWFEGEPIWVSAERSGIPTAASFWPGTEAAIGGVRPRTWRRYDPDADDRARVDEILSWLDRPPAQRPRLLMLYFAEPDRAGHRFGPAEVETGAAVAHVDAMLARLRAGVAARGLSDSTNWIVVSDHGMTEVSPERAIFLEELVDLEGVAIDDVNVLALLRPAAGRRRDLVRDLSAAHPRLHASLREEMPLCLHFRAHRRIPPVVAWVDPGWLLYARRSDLPDRMPAGNHGYDPASPDMHGLFVAGGPAFRRGDRSGPVENVDLYPLLCRLLGLPPAPSDGDPAAFDGLLASPEPPRGR